MRYSLLLLTLLASGLVMAAPPSDRPPELSPVPDGPPGADEASTITIKPDSRGEVEEYRSNGKLYMLKVTPKVGKPYYLIDPSGEGRFNRMETLPGLQPPQWVVKEF
ncbi:MAG: hypothetical protein A2580_16580 [Hydrogenophilales bacterium RIFOXYD1_FULL_62_11]|nr:MAG: hypothetical protein A2580_16580 [Hydrogenophilales bacterium RIFOXYD1_FULL_62_11]